MGFPSILVQLCYTGTTIISSLRRAGGMLSQQWPWVIHGPFDSMSVFADKEIK
jgi:hypothetical protein